MIRQLVVVAPDSAPRRITITTDLFTIGRSPRCDLAFPENSLCSRQHAAIRKNGEDFFIFDLGSSNGTLLNGQRLGTSAPLADGDRIEIGDVTLICIGEEEAARPVSSEVEQPEPPPKAGKPILTFKGQKLSVSVADPTPFAFGRSSTLFRATSQDHGVVCVKLFANVKGAGWQSAAAFEREVLAQTTLSHPNVLPVLDYGLESQPHGSPFVILPFCDGGSLRGLIRERSFYPLAAVLSHLEQAASAVDAAHASGFVHGDIKPENILLAEKRCHVYLCDFGMSNVFAVQERFTTEVPGDPGGTTAYLSPEQIAQSQQTALSDIYAFAMVAYELLTGRLPFDQDLPTFRQMMAKVQGDVLDPRRFSPLITEEIRSALLTGLHRDPLQRPRSATAFCNLLKGSNSQQTVNAPKPTSHRNRVVVSYSHHDSDWLERVRVHLRPLEREQSIEFWDDTRIQPGQNWRDEIANSLEAAACAILIVSSHFLASDFCSLEEVPRLLRTARDRGVTILPLIVSPCRFEQASGISVFQSVNPPSRTLAEMTDPECDRTLLRLAEAVQKAQQEK